MLAWTYNTQRDKRLYEKEHDFRVKILYAQRIRELGEHIDDPFPREAIEENSPPPDYNELEEVSSDDEGTVFPTQTLEVRNSLGRQRVVWEWDREERLMKFTHVQEVKCLVTVRKELPCLMESVLNVQFIVPKRQTQKEIAWIHPDVFGRHIMKDMGLKFLIW